MTWRPLDNVPDPMRLALCDAVRAFVLQHDVGRGIERDGEGLLVVPLPDSANGRIELRPTVQVPARFGSRQAIRYEFDGRAVMGHMSYGLAARATVDIKTKAFVDVTCEILWHDVDSP